MRRGVAQVDPSALGAEDDLELSHGRRKTKSPERGRHEVLEHALPDLGLAGSLPQHLRDLAWASSRGTTETNRDGLDLSE
jgi:hypothetical protein